MSNNGEREVIPRSQYEYPLEVKAEAVAVALATGNCADAYRVMVKRCPDGDAALEVPTIVVDAQGQWLKVEFRDPGGPPQFSES